MTVATVMRCDETENSVMEEVDDEPLVLLLRYIQ